MIELPLGREFQLWEYRVSHGLLLVRSPRGGGIAHNVDILFFGVKYLAVPRFLGEIKIESATQTDITQISQLLGCRISAKEVFILLSEERRFTIVAASYRIDENQMEIFETRLEKVLWGDE